MAKLGSKKGKLMINYVQIMAKLLFDCFYTPPAPQ